MVQGIRNGDFIDFPSVLFSMLPEAPEDWLNALLTKILLNCHQFLGPGNLCAQHHCQAQCEVASVPQAVGSVPKPGALTTPRP